MAVKFIILLIAMAGLSACNTIKDHELLTGSTRVFAPSISSEIDPDYAVAYFPNVAGPVQTVRQQSGKNRVHQTIIYPTIGHASGENQIIIDVAQVKGNQDYVRAPTRRELLIEIKRFFPNMAMQIDELPGENLHGIYGVAYGTSKIDGNCMFAWQVISNVGRQDIDTYKKWFEPNYRAKVRVRYCHPTKSRQQLLVLMNGFRVKNMVHSTMDILRFAEGAGVQNTQSQTAQFQAESVSSTQKVVTKPVAAHSRQVTSKAAKVAQPEGPRVLLPSELDGSAIQTIEAIKDMPATDIVATSFFIPLPD